MADCALVVVETSALSFPRARRCTARFGVPLVGEGMTTRKPRSPLHEDMEDTFTAIGEFVFQFSQLELTMRVLLGRALKLEGDRVDIVTAPYDFAALCRVTEGYLRTSPMCTPELERFLKKTFDRCQRLNQERVAIAHGTWLAPGTILDHVSRTTLKSTRRYETVEQIQKQIGEGQSLMTELGKLMTGINGQWPPIKKMFDR